MIGRVAVVVCGLVAPCALTSGRAAAQDVPGIEICTVEKTMERRTSCLQSNVDFLQKTIAKLAADHQRKLDAANRQIEGLKATVVACRRSSMICRRPRRRRPRIKRRKPKRRRREGSAAAAKETPPAKRCTPVARTGRAK